MKTAGVIVDLAVLAGLALPGVTIYRCWPDFLFAYAGAAILAFVLFGLALAGRRPKDVA